VAGGAWQPGDTVRLLWPTEIETTPESFGFEVRVTGAAAIERGAFDLDTLLDVGDWRPPRRSCWMAGDEPLGGPDVPMAWAFIGSTGPDLPAGDLDSTALETIVKTRAPQHAAVWSSATVSRDSTGGQRFGSSLREGVQIVRLVECRMRVPCQELCVEPIDEDALVILEATTPS
jgi:hypothetical protein